MKVQDELKRLEASRNQNVPWKKWGPYLSERQWGTVREDYSESGDAWNYFTHDQARSRAYRWGEDGIAGISDDKQRLCFALALWNGKDPILKERMFGLTNSEGNHGEDVKEYYFYLDSTPTHSYMKYLYKYPQRAYPYDQLKKVNQQRNRNEFEYELLDTGIFDDNRYFDIFVEYAKESTDEILIKISAANRGPEQAELHLLPTIWFRNTWATWSEGTPRPVLKQANGNTIECYHQDLGRFFLYCDRETEMLFTENETNNLQIFGSPNVSPYVKDGINNCIVQGQRNAVNPDNIGTKASPYYRLMIPPGETAVVRLRLTAREPETATGATGFDGSFEATFNSRLAEADEFYRSITPPSVTGDAATIMRQALGGMLWSKQYYAYEVIKWLTGRGIDPRDPFSKTIRNKEWFHAMNEDIISMPDKWEYPWYAAWDLAFHTISLSMVDLDFAKDQLDMMLRDMYLHPSGQIPAYEWNFSDVNPPVHAWASLFVYNMEKQFQGKGDVDFLKRTFGKLMANFTWWVNRKDRFGRNVFEGGFLGLDNIGVFDRSATLPTGGHIEQADGTAWMSMYCQNMLEIAAEIATYDSTYQELATKFVDHFLWISEAMNRMVGDRGLWDEEDGFYYDVLRMPDGRAVPLKVRSMVGLLPLCATTVIEKYQRDAVPKVVEHAYKRLQRMPALKNSIHVTGPGHFGVNERGILALVNQDKLKRILAKMLDENEFLSPFGIRALSRYHETHPYSFYVDREEYRVDYLPAESNTGMFGGNSNWRGPIWMPVNALIIRSLLQFYLYYGDTFKVECPTGSGRMMNLFEVSKEIAGRLEKLFLRDQQGNRPVFGGSNKFQNDPYWRDNILFYEYFHGDNGAGLGASHQTGWTGLIARLIQIFGAVDEQRYLQAGKRTAIVTPGELKAVA